MTEHEVLCTQYTYTTPLIGSSDETELPSLMTRASVQIWGKQHTPESQSVAGGASRSWDQTQHSFILAQFTNLHHWVVLKDDKTLRHRDINM